MNKLTDTEQEYFDEFFEHFEILPIPVKLAVINKFAEIDKLAKDKMIIFVSMN